MNKGQDKLTRTTRKAYSVTAKVRNQRLEAAKKSAATRKTNERWRSAAVTESVYDWAVAKYGSVNEALKAQKRKEARHV